MNTYKNIEIYNTAFNLAVNVYKMNVMLPNQELIRHGNKLRRLTVQIKDLIAEGYSSSKSEDKLSSYLIQAKIACDETVLLLNKIKRTHSKERSLSFLIMEYIKLKNSIHKIIVSIDKNSLILTIPYQENKVLEPNF
ncbi:MAG: four helix bundle protein [Bacteroidales bacterium]